jgi:mannosyl-3-phosphoglycerate phosphatase
MFEAKYRRIMTVAIGDSLNDLPMLAAVDNPVLVKKITGLHDTEIIHRLPQVHLADGIGPKGWASTVRGIVSGL